MRITFLTPAPGLSGGARVIALHAQWLQSQGHHVVIAHPRLPAFGGTGARLWWERAKWMLKYPQGEPSHFDSLELERIILPLDRTPRDSDLPDADVIVATWWETAEWMAPLSESKGAKAYFVQGHEVFDYLPKERVRATYRLPVRIITVSEWLRATLRREYNLAEVSLVPNGVDLSQFHAPARLRQPRPTVGTVYSSDSFKGSDVCIAAVKLAKASLPDLRFVMFGAEASPHRFIDVPDFAEYHSRPPQQNLAGIYGSCDAWLFGSRAEGFGLPILEAMACRTPVVATPAGAAPELVSGGGGTLVPLESSTEMAGAIVSLCLRPQLEWTAISDRALVTAQQHSWAKMHQAFEHALLKVVEQRPTTKRQSQTAAPARALN
jgi:glycosyltransferase involved in cell wall biosynthesis